MCKASQIGCLPTEVLNQSDFDSQGTLDNVWAYFWLSQRGRGCYCRLAGRDQECCLIFYNAKDSPPHTEEPSIPKSQQHQVEKGSNFLNVLQ